MFMNVCDSSGTLSVILMIKHVITFFKILVPIILILVSAYDLFFTVIDVKNKVYSKIMKRMIALVCIFFIPTFLGLFFNLIGTSNLFNSSCWTNANTETIAVLRNQEKLAEEAEEAAEAAEAKKAEELRKNIEETREEYRKKNEERAAEERRKQEEQKQQQGADDATLYHENGKDGMVEVINGVFYKPVNGKSGVEGSKGSAPYGYNKYFYNRLMAFVNAGKAAGHTINIGANDYVAWRPYAKQEYFYNCYITKSCNNGNLAAVPGTSNHGWGIASDLSFGSPAALYWAHDNCSKFGLRFPICENVRGSCVENWHIEPAELKSK